MEAKASARPEVDGDNSDEQDKVDQSKQLTNQKEAGHKVRPCELAPGKQCLRVPRRASQGVLVLLPGFNLRAEYSIAQLMLLDSVKSEYSEHETLGRTSTTRRHLRLSRSHHRRTRSIATSPCASHRPTPNLHSRLHHRGHAGLRLGALGVAAVQVPSVQCHGVRDASVSAAQPDLGRPAHVSVLRGRGGFKKIFHGFIMYQSFILGSTMYIPTGTSRSRTASDRMYVNVVAKTFESGASDRSICLLALVEEILSDSRYLRLTLTRRRPGIGLRTRMSCRYSP